MNSKNLPYIGLFIIVVIFGFRSVFYVVPEGRQALVFQLGKIQGDTKKQPGLYMKLPFVQRVEYLDSRVLNWDGNPEEVPTGDKQYVIVDTTARYKISDAKLFRNRLKTLKQAQSRIDKVLDSATKSVISSHNFVESVRNTNNIFEAIEAQREERRQKEATGNNLTFIEQEVIGEIPTVEVGREKLSQEIIDKARKPLADFGIELIDVQLRRIGYKEGVEKEVHERMISERQRIAERIRSVGKGEQEKIKGIQEFELRSIQSKAYKKVQEIKGKAEAEAIEIYAEAVGENQEFYRFLRTLDAYRDGIREDSSFILSSDSKLFEVLQEGIAK